jgi:hypothetical protein
MKNKAIILLLVSLVFTAVAYQSLHSPSIMEAPRYPAADESNKTTYPAPASDLPSPAAKQIAEQQKEIGRLRRENSEIPKLRSEVARLSVKIEFGPIKQPAKTESEIEEDPFESAVKDLALRAAELNRHMQNLPNFEIPELQMLEEADWLSAAKGADFDSKEGIRKALSKVRQKAKTQFAELATAALNEYFLATKGSVPTDPSQLLPFFKTPIDASLLQRYQLVPSSTVPGLMETGYMILSEKAPVDREYDTHFYIGKKGVASFAIGPTGSNDPDTTWATR